MHRVFEQASDLDEIGRIIDEQLHSGALTNEEAGQLGANISTAMLDPVVNGWFDGSWEQVRNENEIIIPADQVTHERNYRPDRVMTRGGQAVVVDYKFGLGADNRYAKQIAGYKSLLASMGYTDVKGYIWYVSLGRIVEV